MIRQMIRPVRLRRLVALAAVVGIASTGVPSVWVSASETPSGAVGTAWTVRILDANGKVVDLAELKAQATQRTPAAIASVTDIEIARIQLKDRAEGTDPRAAAIARRM